MARNLVNPHYFVNNWLSHVSVIMNDPLYAETPTAEPVVKIACAFLFVRRTFSRTERKSNRGFAEAASHVVRLSCDTAQTRKCVYRNGSTYTGYDGVSIKPAGLR